MAPDGPSLEDWVAEFRRRKIFRVAAVYAGVGFVLVQAAAYLFDALLFPPWAHRLFVVFVVLGFPVALVMAWAFELTPEGFRPSSKLAAEEGDDGDEAGGQRGLDWSGALPAVGLTLIVAVGVAAAGWAAWHSWLAPTSSGAAVGDVADGDARELPATRIAVLYFDDHTEGGRLGHVAAGLTESLIHELNRAPGLDVVSRNGVKPYRNPDVSLDSIARVLGAGSLVEGSVEREGDDLQVTVQLVDGATASHIMSEQVRGRADASLDVRNELVEKVAGLLRRRLGQSVHLREARAETESSRAWELYHLGREIQVDADSFRQEGDPDGARQLYLDADSTLARAERMDPAWSRPTVERGLLAQKLAQLDDPEVRNADQKWLRRGIEHVDRVLADDPNHAGALERRGELRYFLAASQGSEEAETTFRAAKEDLRRAVSVDPERAGAWSRLAYILWDRESRFAEARSAMRRSREADPFLREDRDYLYQRISLALDMEDFERTDRLLREASEAYPDEPAFLFKRLQYLASVGSAPEQVEEAWRFLTRFESRTGTAPWPPGRALVAAVAARAGMADSAERMLGRAPEASELSSVALVNTAYARLQLGDEEETLDLLERYLALRPGQREYVSREWWWRPLHDAPGFRRLVSRPDSSQDQEGVAGAVE